MQSKIKFAVGAGLFLTLLVVMFALSLKTRQNGSEPNTITLPEREIVLDSSINVNEPKVTESDRAFGPDSNPVILDPSNETQLTPRKGRSLAAVDFKSYDSLNLSQVRDVEFVDNRVLLATAGGVVEFYPDDSSFAIYSYLEGLSSYDCYTVAELGGDVYAGTIGGVYWLNPDGVAEQVWEEIAGKVSSLYYADGIYYIGTDSLGLFSVTNDSVTNILPSESIVDIVKYNDLLWVATEGKGLFSYDGSNWKPRYLKSDSTALSHVNCLETSQGKLWAGTPHGVRVFDGGTWDLIDTSDFLFDLNVTAIERGRKFVYFGTANSGLFAYYDGALSPLDWSENLPVTSLDIDQGNYLVGLQTEGAILKSADAQIDIPSLLEQLTGLAWAF